MLKFSVQKSVFQRNVKIKIDKKCLNIDKNRAKNYIQNFEKINIFYAKFSKFWKMFTVDIRVDKSRNQQQKSELEISSVNAKMCVKNIVRKYFLEIL